MGGVFYEGHREKIIAWKIHAIVLYERWRWTPEVVEELDVEDFVFYTQTATELYEAEARAMRG